MTRPSDLTVNNYKKALVIALNDYIDDDITLLLEGTLINCFISYCPYEIEVGKIYDVELTINLSDDYQIERVAAQESLIEKAAHGYSYVLYGDLCNDTLLTFTSLNIEGVHYDHPDCNEHFIKLVAERIDVSFQ